MSVDQKGVVVRHQDLLPATQKQAAAGRKLALKSLWFLTPSTRCNTCGPLAISCAPKAVYKDLAELEKWVLERFKRLLEGHASDVAAGMRRSASKRHLSPTQRKPIDKALNYFLKRKNLMHYDLCLKAGTPIASGVIEGACSTLIGDRLDITGARWSVDGAEAILKLRALAQSRDFDEHWTFHIEREYQRHHASKYVDDKPPGLVLSGFKPSLRAVK